VSCLKRPVKSASGVKQILGDMLSVALLSGFVLGEYSRYLGGYLNLRLKLVAYIVYVIIVEPKRYMKVLLSEIHRLPYLRKPT
jgi:hypothetical protein